MKKILPIFAIWFVVVNIFALFAFNRLNVKADTAYPWINPMKTHLDKSWDIVSFHAHWDSWWYVGIAEQGYIYNQGQLSNVVFFPLYPMLIKALALPLLGNTVLAGWIISAVCLLLALWFLYKLVKEFHPEADPELTLVFLLVFPTAFFFSLVYTESLFLFLSIASIYFARKRQFAYAGVFGLLAALSRVTGILLFVPLLMEYFSGNRQIKKDIAWLALVPLGTFSFFLFHLVKFGNFFLFALVEKSWGRGFNTDNLHGLGYYLRTPPATVNMLMDLGFIALTLILAVYVYKKVRASYAVYMSLTLAIALSTGTIMSIGRYILVLFPLYIAGASLKNYYLRYTWLFVSILLFGLYTTLFVNYYWAG